VRSLDGRSESVAPRNFARESNDLQVHQRATLDVMLDELLDVLRRRICFMRASGEFGIALRTDEVDPFLRGRPLQPSPKCWPCERRARHTASLAYPHRLACQGGAVADDVGDAVENLGCLVVVTPEPLSASTATTPPLFRSIPASLATERSRLIRPAPTAPPRRLSPSGRGQRATGK
jgi:hypothetical protein